MTTGETDVLTFSYTPVGDNGRAKITAKLGEKVLALDELNTSSAKARGAFTKRLCQDRAGIAQDDVDNELLKIATAIQARRDRKPPGPALSDELDISRIVRPERFIMPDVSGLTVATPVLQDDKPAGQWITYLQWADGRREAVELPDAINLSDGRKLWIWPTPGAPTISASPAWTNAARKAWLNGADSPDPADVFKRLCQCIAYYIDFPEQHAPGTTATLALWTMLTYFSPAWVAVPYLYLGGPMGSGKSRTFNVLSRLVFRPLTTSNMTAAALFRTLDSRGGTLLYDEAERLRDTTPDVTEIRSMLLAGYQRGGRATRLEPVGDSYKTVEFDVFGPKALACVKGLPPILASRCISIIMFRAAKGSAKPRRRINSHPKKMEALRADLHALAMDFGADFPALARRDDVCPAMSGRDFEKWQPLLALAAWVEDHGADGLLSLMQGYAEATIESGIDDQTPDSDEILLRMLAAEVNTGQQAQLTPGDLLSKVKETHSALFERWSSKGVGRALKRYGISTTRGHTRNYRDISVKQIANIEQRYGMDLICTIGKRANDTNDAN